MITREIDARIVAALQILNEVHFAGKDAARVAAIQEILSEVRRALSRVEGSNGTAAAE